MKRTKLFYGWYIVLAGVGIGALSSTLFVYGFSAFFIPWRDQFGWSRAALGGVVGLARLEGGIAAPVAGWCVDHFGPRRMMFIGMSIMGMGFIVLSRVSSLMHLYLVFLLFLAVGASFGTNRPIQVATANWFVRKRGRAMGFLAAGGGVGGSLVFLFAILIDNLGWEKAAVIAGFMIWGIGLPLASIVRHRPEDMGFNVDGDPPVIDNLQLQSEEQVESLRGANVLEGMKKDSTIQQRHFWQRDDRAEFNLTTRQALRTQAFWILALTYAIWAAMPGITTVHIAPFLAEELEIEYVTALAALSFFVAASIIGRIGFGFMADYFNIRMIMSFLFIFQGLGLFLFSEVHSLVAVPFYVVLFAIPYGGTLPMRSIIQGHFFGRKNFGTIGGFLQFVDLPATVAAPIWVGWLADTFPDGYRLGFKIVALTMVGAAVIILFARRPREPLPEVAPLTGTNRSV